MIFQRKILCDGKICVAFAVKSAFEEIAEMRILWLIFFCLLFQLFVFEKSSFIQIVSDVISMNKILHLKHKCSSENSHFLRKMSSYSNENEGKTLTLLFIFHIYSYNIIVYYIL